MPLLRHHRPYFEILEEDEGGVSQKVRITGSQRGCSEAYGVDQPPIWFESATVPPDGRRELLWACEGPIFEQIIEDSEDIANAVTKFGEKLTVPIGTAALSIWVDKNSYLSNGVNFTSKDGTAEAADGREIEAAGAGMLTFSFRVKTFSEFSRNGKFARKNAGGENSYLTVRQFSNSKTEILQQVYT